jgi:benzoyl-CoA reductase/2-hydroxyglutaryl-CoA dehydratase subunit BcrC/BadD/HgdB
MFHELLSETTKKKIKEYGRPAAGWFCSYTPIELIDAAGYTPVRISGVRQPSGAADSIMHTNICPYIKACVEAAESGELDFLDIVVLTNGCDAQRRLYDVWESRKPDKPVFLLMVPKKDTQESVAQFSGQIAEYKTWLEEITGEAIGDEKIRESIRKYVNMRKAAAELDEKRRLPDSPVSGSRFMELILTAQRIPASEALKLLAGETSEGTATAAIGPTVMIAGNMLDDPEWVRMIESYGARVVADDLCTGRRFWDMQSPDMNSKPLDALAASYLSKPPCPRMAVEDDSVAYMKRHVEQIRPDGVIFHILKFCDTHLYNVPRLRKMMQEMDIRTLFIESDYTAASGQEATRIQAFIEMF